MEGSTDEPEYQGREYVEYEGIVGCADKCIFYAKELISDLTVKPKPSLNPFIMAKLDLNSIKYYQFPAVKVRDNKYTLWSEGFSSKEII